MGVVGREGWMDVPPQETKSERTHLRSQPPPLSVIWSHVQTFRLALSYHIDEKMTWDQTVGRIAGQHQRQESQAREQRHLWSATRPAQKALREMTQRTLGLSCGRQTAGGRGGRRALHGARLVMEAPVSTQGSLDTR